MLWLMSGGRAAFFDRLGKRADFVILLLLLPLFWLLHLAVKRYVAPWLDRYFSPARYDERRILFDLGQEARAAKNINQLYQLIVNQIAGALDTESVSIFVRDDATGHYVCRMISSKPGAEEVSDPGDRYERFLLEHDAFTVKRLRHLAIPLDIGPEDFDLWTRAFSTASPKTREARERERATLDQVQSRLLLQIMIKEQLVGILSLGPRRSRHPFSPADKEMLMAVAGQLAFVIENSKLVERMVAEERLRRELALAAEVQRRLLPDQPPTSPGLEMAGFCQPARGVGGDYYDFLSFENEQIGIAVADVAGKGISAALLMSTVQATLRSQAMAHNSRRQDESSLADLVSTMNILLCQSTGTANYVTFFYGQFDGRTQQLTYVNAGHNPPFLYRRQEGEPIKISNGNGQQELTSLTGQAGAAMAEIKEAQGDAVPAEFLGTDRCSKLTAGGMVIGMFKNSRYEQETVHMQHGDVLVAFTDGLSEALDTQGEEYGETRLEDLLADIAHLSANEIRNEIVEHVQVWCEGAPQHDDLTFIVFKVI